MCYFHPLGCCLFSTVPGISSGQCCHVSTEVNLFFGQFPDILNQNDEFSGRQVIKKLKNSEIKTDLSKNTINSVDSIETQMTTTTCGDWIPYKEEKCLKIAEKAGFQTQADGEVICKAYADDLNNEATSKLITIKTKEEQDFVERFLFVENKYLDNGWLGLVKNRNSQLFEWNDGSQLSFSNWANESISDNEHECVQIDSGEGTLARGVWLKVNCKKRNMVICQKRPSWTFETLQNEFLNFKLEQERNVKALKQELAKSEEEQKKLKQELGTTTQNHETKQNVLEKELDNLKTITVPVGFIYMQLPQQDPPTTLWPATKWIEISSKYSGLFFRVVGEKAEEFGKIQEGNSPRLKQVQFSANAQYELLISIPPDGSWSNFIATGKNENNLNHLRFQHSTDEVRPRNQAIKVWQRIR